MAEGRALPDLTARLRVNTEDLKRAGGEAEGLAGHMKLSFGELAKTLGEAFAVEKVWEFVKGGFEAIAEMDKLQHQTAAVITSTGAAAGVSADHVKSYAEQLQNTTAVSKEQIQSSENLLLTFTNIKNGVGESNQIFDQATLAATNMSVALGQDAKSSSIQLGKALQDPIKGVTALARVGVTFDAQQKAQIKTMVKAGDTMGAQKLILNELNREFGGSGAAYASSYEGQMAKLGFTMKELSVKLATALLPVIQRLLPFISEAADALGAVLPGAMDFLGGVITKVMDILQPFVDLFRTFFDDLKAGNDPISAFADLIGGIGQKLGVPAGIMNVLSQAIAGTIGNFVTLVGDLASGKGIIDSFAGYFGRLAALWTGFFAPGKSAQVGGFVTGIVKHLHDVVDFVTTKVIPAVQLVVGFIIARVGDVLGWFQEVWPQISSIVSDAMSIIHDVVVDVVAVITWIWDHFGSQIITLVKGAWDTVHDIFVAAFKVIADIFSVFADLFHGNWSKMWEDVKKLFGDVWNSITKIIGDVLSAIIPLAVKLLQDLASAIWTEIQHIPEQFVALLGLIAGALWNIGTWLIEHGKSLVGGMVTGLVSRVGDVIGFFTGIPGHVWDALTAIWEDIKSIGSRIIDGIIEGVKGAAGRLAGAVGDAVRSATPGGPVDWNAKLGNAGIPIPAHAAGGFFSSPHIAMVGDAPGGEYVLNMPQMRDLIGAVAGGGATYNVTVNAGGGPDVNGAAIGRDVAWELKSLGGAR